jgi:leader peptidase (prepilin peptidase)/N-methyltransferase
MLVRLAAVRRWTSIQVATGIAAVVGVTASLVAAPNVQGMAGAGLALIMIAIAVVDARRFIIPDDLNIAALALALVNATFGGNEPAVAAIVSAVVRGCALSLAFLGLRVIYHQLRKRDGLGLGDVKLAGVAGAWLGWQTMSIAVEIAAVSALIVYLGRQRALRRPLRSTSHLPFGLFLAPAIWLGWLIETMWLAPQ